ncbi:MAG: TetR/AcrR family transcriptional regulator [Deltaproteobacteria bacterium]|nr:TetR/AcrR family transcriptional regulator [Deltaproteobacteria bacterium]
MTEEGPRERILAAALELFVEKGYFNTNIPDISKKSHCSVGSIYHHFVNKEEIADQLYKDGSALFRKALLEVIDPEGQVKDNIRGLIIAFLYFAEKEKLLAKYLWLARHSEFLSQKVYRPTVIGLDPLGRVLAKVIKKAIRSGEIASLKAEVIWVIIFGIPVSFLLDWLDGNTKILPSAVATALADASWSALKSSVAKV